MPDPTQRPLTRKELLAIIERAVALHEEIGLDLSAHVDSKVK